MEETLKTKMDDAISGFNNRRSEILEAAYAQGGRDAVTALVQQYDALRDIYFELLRHELDANNALYGQLTADTLAEAEKLQESVNQLDNINELIGAATAVTNLIGRMITVLAV